MMIFLAALDLMKSTVALEMMLFLEGQVRILYPPEKIPICACNKITARTAKALSPSISGS